MRNTHAVRARDETESTGRKGMRPLRDSDSALLDKASLAVRDFTATAHSAGQNEFLAERLRGIERHLREEALAGFDLQQAALATFRDVLSGGRHWRSVFREKARNSAALAQVVRDGQSLLADALEQTFGANSAAGDTTRSKLSAVLGNTSVRTRVLRTAAGSMDNAALTADVNLPSSPNFAAPLVARLIAAVPGTADPADLRNGILALRAAHHEFDQTAHQNSTTAAAPWAAAATLLERSLLGHAAAHARAGGAPLRLTDRERLVALSREYDDARDELVTNNLRLAVSVAGWFASRDYPLEAALSAASKGLLSAAEMYEPDRETKFSTYAVTAMRRSIARDRTVDQHPMIRERASSVHAYEEAAHEARGRGTQPPPVENIAATLGVGADVLTARIQAAGRPVELSRRIRAFDPTQVEDADDVRGQGEQAGLGIAGQIEDAAVRSPGDAASNRELRAVLHDALQALTYREREVLTLRFAEDWSQLEVAKVFQVTADRVRQIEERALNKMQHSTRGQKLQGFHDVED